jgi:hypothetical protein
MNVIYLQKSLSVNGRSALRGRKLLDKFRNESKECLLGHAVVTNDSYTKWKEEASRRDLISYDMLQDVSPDLVYLEGGMLASETMWKVPLEMANALVTSGAVIVINDIDINDVRNHESAMDKVFTYAGATVQRLNGSPVYAGAASGSPAELRLLPEKMLVSDWLRPVYSRVESVIVSWAMRLSYFGDILASGNRGEHGTLASDVWVDELDCCPFASVRQIGDGFVVLVAATSTGWSEEHDGTLRWLLNIGRFLCETAQTNKLRSSSHRHSPHSLFLSHRSTDKAIVDAVAAGIKTAGVGVWYDNDKMLPSDSLVAKINEGIADMSHFILFWSTAALQSNWVERELNAAVSRLIEHKTPIIIVRLDQTPVPALVADLFRVEAATLEPAEIARTLVTTVERLAQRSQK